MSCASSSRLSTLGQLKNLQKLPVHCAFQTGHFLKFNVSIDHPGEVGVGRAELWGDSQVSDDLDNPDRLLALLLHCLVGEFV